MTMLINLSWHAQWLRNIGYRFSQGILLAVCACSLQARSLFTRQGVHLFFYIFLASSALVAAGLSAQIEAAARPRRRHAYRTSWQQVSAPTRRLPVRTAAVALFATGCFSSRFCSCPGLFLSLSPDCRATIAKTIGPREHHGAVHHRDTVATLLLD